MAEPEGPGVSDNLYALIVYLHVSSNRDLLEAIATQELSFSEVQLLEHLRSGRRRPTIQQVASVLHVTKGGASRIVDRLARRGLVKRETDDHSYRFKRVIITERGEQAIATIHAARLADVIAFTNQLDDDELHQLGPALERLLERDQIAAYRPPPLAA